MPRLEMRAFFVRVLIVPTAVDVALFGSESRTETWKLYGYTRKDAMRRAGVTP